MPFNKKSESSVTALRRKKSRVSFSEITFVFVQKTRDKDDHGKLDRLRRLKSDRADLEPSGAGVKAFSKTCKLGKEHKAKSDQIRRNAQIPHHFFVAEEGKNDHYRKADQGV